MKTPLSTRSVGRGEGGAAAPRAARSRKLDEPRQSDSSAPRATGSVPARAERHPGVRPGQEPGPSPRVSEGIRVVKVGGALLDDPRRLDRIARAIARSARVRPTVVVHGGGGRVSEIASRFGLETRFEAGLRVTDAAMLEVVLMVLAGTVNKTLVAALTRAGARAVGLAAGDGGLAVAERLRPASGVDLGQVGAISSVRPALLLSLLEAGFLPVLAPLAIAPSGEWLNVNADQVASSLARALGASRLVYLTDVPGVLGADGAVVPSLAARAAMRMIETGEVRGGMKPKLEACGEALSGGVGEVLILPGAAARLLGVDGEAPSRGTRLTL